MLTRGLLLHCNPGRACAAAVLPLPCASLCCVQRSIGQQIAASRRWNRPHAEERLPLTFRRRRVWERERGSWRAGGITNAADVHAWWQLHSNGTFKIQCGRWIHGPVVRSVRLRFNCAVITTVCPCTQTQRHVSCYRALVLVTRQPPLQCKHAINQQLACVLHGCNRWVHHVPFPSQYRPLILIAIVRLCCNSKPINTKYMRNVVARLHNPMSAWPPRSSRLHASVDALGLVPSPYTCPTGAGPFLLMPVCTACPALLDAAHDSSLKALAARLHRAFHCIPHSLVQRLHMCLIILTLPPPPNLIHTVSFAPTTASTTTTIIIKITFCITGSTATAAAAVTVQLQRSRGALRTAAPATATPFVPMCRAEWVGNAKG